MACASCPKCDLMIDIDGFVGMGVPALYWCECGSIFEMREFGHLYEVKKKEVNLEGLEQYEKARKNKTIGYISEGLFILKIRWMGISTEDLQWYLKDERYKKYIRIEVDNGKQK